MEVSQSTEDDLPSSTLYPIESRFESVSADSHLPFLVEHSLDKEKPYSVRVSSLRVRMDHASTPEDGEDDAPFPKESRCESTSADSHLPFPIETSSENPDMSVDSMRVRPIADDDLSEPEEFSLSPESPEEEDQPETIQLPQFGESVLKKYAPVTGFTKAIGRRSSHKPQVRFSRRYDIEAMFQAPLRRYVRVYTAYKRKADKVRPVDTDKSDGAIPGGKEDWKAEILEQEAKIQTDPNRPYKEWLIPKFSDIPRGSRLTPERLGKMIVGDELTIQERDMLTEMLYNREASLAWEFSEIGKVRPEVAPPQIIKTVEHRAWQAPGFPIPKALTGIVTEMLKERVSRGTLEPCHGPYRNPWFLVKKKEAGKYRLVNAAMEMNRVTVRDANLPPATDEFAEDFAGCAVASLIDFFSGYDQIGLDTTCRDLTAFMTPIGLLRMTTLPQGATNSVAQFVRIVTRILRDHIPDKARPFLDDIGVKGPKTTYNNEEVLPGIRRYMAEHIKSLDGVLADIERAGCTISGPKSHFCMRGLKVVGYICDVDGRHPDTAKVIKIIDWPECRDPTEARAFIGLCVYYRIWVEKFALVAEPIYRLLKKDAEFIWDKEQTESMDRLKIALTTAPALISLDYSEDAGDIILAVDASLTGWGSVLMQIKEKKRHPSRYESGIWSTAEAKYDATKRECRGVLKALKKVRYWLYGVHFILETDAEVLVAQLNRSGTDLPGALITRWIAWIRLFDFDVKHIAGKKHTAADGLSRRPATQDDVEEAAKEPDIEDFIEAELNSVRIAPISVDVENPLEEDGNYSPKSIQIATYLITLRNPAGMSRKKLKAFKSEAMRYKVQDKHLFRRNSRNVPLRRVVDSPEDRIRIIQQLHDETGHRGREGTYRRIADRYWWDNLHQEVRQYIQTCEECQKRSSTRTEEALHPTWVSLLWEKVGLDVVHMPTRQGKSYLVVARDDLSGWVEARALSKANSENVAKFLWEDVICRHGIFGKLIVDGGPENKKKVDKLATKFKIRRVVVSGYHPQANGMVERGHKPIVDALSKMTNGGITNWVDNLPAVLWADRTTVRKSTGYTPFYLNCGYEAIMPIELEIPTWRILPWNEVRDTSDLIAMRARQIQRRDEDLEEAALFLQRMREQGKEIFDETKSIREHPIVPGMMVLLHDTKLDNNHTGKLLYKWLGPYLIENTTPKGTYTLMELNGTQLAGTYPGNRLKEFHPRQHLSNIIPTEPNSSNHGTIANDEGTDHVDPFQNFSPETLQAAIPPGQSFAVVIPNRNDNDLETVEAN